MSYRNENIAIRRTEQGKRYYKNVLYPEVSLSPSDLYIISTEGDRLDNLSQQYYNNPEDYWILIAANPGKIKRDSLFITPGLQIRIPVDIRQIKSSFKTLNKL